MSISFSKSYFALSLKYDRGIRAEFKALPPDRRRALRAIQSSCRKPTRKAAEKFLAQLGDTEKRYFEVCEQMDCFL